MRKRGAGFAFCLVFLAFPLLVTAGERVYPIFPLTREPVLDGRIKGDAAWEKIPFATGFFRFQSQDYAFKQTSFGIGYLSDKALYVGFICMEPEMEKIKANCEDGDINIWTEDSIEIFLFPRGADNYYQFMVNAIGSRWNGKGQGPPYFPTWNWEARTYRGADFYSVELKIPFDVLGRIPELGETWRGNFCRNIYSPQDRATRWGRGGFHDPESFAALIFGRKRFEEKMRNLANEIGKSQREFVKIEGTAFYREHQEEISHYLKRWKKIEEKMVSPDRLSPLELWEVYEQLVSESGFVDKLRQELFRQSLFTE